MKQSKIKKYNSVILFATKVTAIILISHKSFSLEKINTKPQSDKSISLSQLQARSNNKSSSENNESFNIERRFFGFPSDVNKIKNDSVAACRKKFIDLCGNEDTPGIRNFSMCLQKNYAKFENEKNCALLAHYVIYIRFISTLTDTLTQCNVYVEYCETKFKKKSDITSCVFNEKNIHPICIKLIQEFSYHRKNISSIFHVDFNKE